MYTQLLITHEYLSILKPTVGFPAHTLIDILAEPVLYDMLNLVDDPDTLDEAFESYDHWNITANNSHATKIDFTLAVVAITDCVVILCDWCRDPVWEDDTNGVAGNERVCEGCFDEHYYCCYSCEEYHHETTTVDDNEYCESCLDRRCSYCEECDEYYRDSNADQHDHREGCDCDAPHRTFEFPANGEGWVRQNERLTIELPKGVIDDRGMANIRRLVFDETTAVDWSAIDEVLADVGPTWQTKRGNFTRRLSSGLYKRSKIKLAPEVISEIGNIAREHSSEGAEWNVEFTRDLNGSADEFYHDESCWWTSHYASRCALKNWGGIGLRTYHDGALSYSPNGRAWVQPVNENLRPTHDTNAHGYIIFNAYGEDLTGYVAARIVAHLSGHTYKKISFNADDMYVNSEAGYLVADEQTCEDADSVYWHFDVHDRQDADTYYRTNNRQETAA